MSSLGEVKYTYMYLYTVYMCLFMLCMMQVQVSFIERLNVMVETNSLRLYLICIQKHICVPVHHMCIVSHARVFLRKYMYAYCCVNDPG